jgi:hypothetical protein
MGRPTPERAKTATGPDEPGESQDLPERSAGGPLGDLVSDQLLEDREQRRYLEQKGTAVITTSGTLVTLLFGLAAIVTSSGSFVLTSLERNLLIASLSAFVIAAGGGIAVKWPRRYGEANAETLQTLTADLSIWSMPAYQGERATAAIRAQILARARWVNRRKAYLLVGALASEVVGVASAAVTVGLILRS